MVAHPPTSADPGSEQAAIGLVLALARALHRYGTPAHRLEEAMAVMARGMGLRAEFFSTPTTIIVSFGEPEELRTAMQRVEGGELDMDKLAQLDAIGDAVIAGRLAPGDARARIDAIVDARPRYGHVVSTLAHAITTAAVVVFFHGSAIDMAVAGGIGLSLGVLSQLLRRSTAQARVFELLGAFIAAFVAGVVAAHVDGVSSSVVTIAGLLVLMPGLTLTNALTELATDNLISGTARLMAAIIVLLELALGVAVGEAAAAALVHIPATTPVPLPAWSEWLAVVASALAMVVIVRAHPRAAPWIVVATLTGFVGARTGTSVLGPELGVMFGAFALGVLVNVYVRLLRRPGQVVLVPAMLLLVPGSVGFRGISSMLHRNTLTGIETTFAMFVVAMAIVAGLLIANAALSPRRVL